MTMRAFRGSAIVAAVALMVQLGACAKKPAPQPSPTPQPPPVVVQPTPPPPPPPPPKPTPTPPPPPRVPTDEEVFAAKSIEDLAREHPLADVFFVYDSAELTEASRLVLQKNGDWLKRWTSVRVTVEGHADSRGTNEYNLALGERRASTVRDYMISLGLPPSRFAVVSKGEEEPVCKDEAESCWSQNRRAHFVITAK